MEDLGQLGLGGMPARARRVVLSAGPRAWWGVDSSTKGVAIGWREPDGRRGVSEVRFDGLEGPARLRAIVERTRHLAAVLDVEHSPGFVALEKPAAPAKRAGKQQGPNFPMLYAVGAVQAGLAMGLQLQPTFDVEVIAATWKKAVCGRGDIWKPKPAAVRAGATYGVYDWAVLNGFEVGSSWDRADACAIAAYAELTVEIRVR